MIEALCQKCMLKKLIRLLGANFALYKEVKYSLNTLGELEGCVQEDAEQKAGNTVFPANIVDCDASDDTLPEIDTISSDRIRKAIGELYSEQFNILLYLTTFYFFLVTMRDIVTQPEGKPLLLAADFIILSMLATIYFLERRGTINTENVYLTPIPIAFAMLVNGYMHIFLSGEPLTLVKGILMTVAFGIVSLLPWIFWLLLSLSMISFFIAAVWLMGGDSGAIIVLGVGAAMISYGSFAMRYNSVRKQIALTLVNEERAQKLETVGKAKDQFIANISHELRTPLTGLLGMVNLIDKQGLSQDQSQQLAAAKSSADTLGAIIGDLLDVSKLDAGKLELKISPLDIEKTVRSVVLVMQGQVKEGVSLTCELPSDPMPFVMGDASRVRQVLFNLVGNALKFTDEGSVKLSVSRLKDASNVKLRFEVQDTGVGIPEEKLTKLFDRFEQVDASSTRGRAGTGLGLAIAQELAILMGSDIHVESQIGQGSRFWFDIEFSRAPLRDQNGETNQSSDTVKHLSEYEIEKQLAQPLNILVAEDNPVSQLLISKLLERSGWNVQLVADGRAALKAAENTSFDIILMDIQMPEMNGETAVKHIRVGNGPNKTTPIVALTANCQEGDIERYAKIGFSMHVGKPIHNAEFYGAIASLVRSAPIIPNT